MKNKKALMLLLLLILTACSTSPKVEHTSSLTSSTPTFVPQPSETPQTTSLFTHPRQIYTLSYPVNWRQEIVVREPENEEVAFTSPDYRISEGYPILEKGAEFLYLQNRWRRALPLLKSTSLPTPYSIP